MLIIYRIDKEVNKWKNKNKESSRYTLKIGSKQLPFKNESDNHINNIPEKEDHSQDSDSVSE